MFTIQIGSKSTFAKNVWINSWERKAVSDMARYYEENALIEFVKQYTPTIDGETTLECVERAIRNAPTADVVPKSEYDEVLSNWQKIHDSYNSDCIEHYKYGRAEVAREIFEEIPKIFVNRILHNESQYFEGVLDNITKDLDKLEEKYTEGEK